jgi:putative DNA primase/helicase
MDLSHLDGFNLVGLLGSSLALVDETPMRINEQRLKVLISGGLTLVDRKYRDPLSFYPLAKWIILGNQLPAVSDQTYGFWRRIKIIPFQTRFDDGQQDSSLAEKIIGGELSGVLNWAVGGLIRLLERGHFPPPPTAVAKALREGQRETNSVLAWWRDDDEHVADTEIETPRKLVYAAYSDWCTNNGMCRLAAPKFWGRMRAGVNFAEKQKNNHGNRVRVVGLQLSREERQAAKW